MLVVSFFPFSPVISPLPCPCRCISKTEKGFVTFVTRHVCHAFCYSLKKVEWILPKPDYMLSGYRLILFNVESINNFTPHHHPRQFDL